MTFSKPVFAAAVMLALAGCGPLTYAVRANQLAIGADAIITADVNKESSLTTVGIVIDNLAPADRIKPGASHFIAWQRSGSDATWSRIGALAYDEGARHAKLEGVTVPEQHFELTVSVEETVDPASPSATVILSQQVN